MNEASEKLSAILKLVKLEKTIIDDRDGFLEAIEQDLEELQNIEWGKYKMRFNIKQTPKKDNLKTGNVILADDKTEKVTRFLLGQIITEELEVSYCFTLTDLKDGAVETFEYESNVYNFLKKHYKNFEILENPVLTAEEK